MTAIRASSTTTPIAVLKHFIAIWREIVVSAQMATGCPLVGVTVDTPVDDRSMMRLLHAEFQRWTDTLSEQFVVAGLTNARARSVAFTALAAMEGALLLSRAAQGPEPIDRVAAELLSLVAKTRR